MFCGYEDSRGSERLARYTPERMVMTVKDVSFYREAAVLGVTIIRTQSRLGRAACRLPFYIPAIPQAPRHSASAAQNALQARPIYELLVEPCSCSLECGLRVSGMCGFWMARLTRLAAFLFVNIRL